MDFNIVTIKDLVLKFLIEIKANLVFVKNGKEMRPTNVKISHIIDPVIQGNYVDNCNFQCTVVLSITENHCERLEKGRICFEVGVEQYQEGQLPKEFINKVYNNRIDII